MKIRVLGGHGGLSRGFATTSFLIDEKLLIDAGSVALSLSIEQQAKIDHILISHCHLDHIKDLAFISDNCFEKRENAFEVYTHRTVKKIIKEHLLNDVVWPDFTILPSKEKPTIRINAIESEETILVGEYLVTPVKVNHPLDAMGFVIEKKDKSILFTMDTGPTEKIWEMAKKVKNLKAIFTEVSFPNEMQKVADLSNHLTPESLKKEIEKMPANVPVVLTHFKPNYRLEILNQLAMINEPRIRPLENDGEFFEF